MTHHNGHKPKRQRRPRDYEDPDGVRIDGRKLRYAGEDDCDLNESARPAFHGDPSAVISKHERLVVQGKRYFKLAPHQRTIEAHPLGRFGVACETGFKVLRDPRTGWPVVREHGDLKPGEVSLVLE